MRAVPTSAYKKNMEQQLEALLKLIYETENCRVLIADDLSWVKFVSRNNGSVSRGFGVHGAAMPTLRFILGNQDFHGCNTLEIGHLMPDEVLVRINSEDVENKFKKFSNLEEIIELLLQYELGRILISEQNFKYFEAFRDYHPRSGKGATDSYNLCRDYLELLDVAIKIKIKHDPLNKDIFIKFESEDEALQFGAMLEIRDILKARSGRADELLINQKEIISALTNLKDRKTNYQGVIPFDRNGSIYIANRRNSYGVLGYATAGGHCSNPYHPKTSVLHELQDEFGFKLADFADLSHLLFLEKRGDVAIYAIDDQYLQLTNGASLSLTETKARFYADSQEFIPNSACIISFKEMRDSRVPLRNIRSLEAYLEYSARGLQKILRSRREFAGIDCVIPFKTTESESRIVKFPNSDFGVINFFAEDLISLKAMLDSLFGGDAKINLEKKCVTIEDLNPKQIIDVLEGRVLRQEIEEYRQSQKKVSAANIITKFVKKSLSGVNVAEFLHLKTGSSGDGIKQLSKTNLAKVKRRLRLATFLPPEERAKLAEEREGDIDIFTDAEKELFKTLCDVRYFLDHATFGSMQQIRDSDFRMFDRSELIKKELREEDPSFVDDDGIEKIGYDDLLKLSGVDKKVFFTVGVKSSVPQYFMQTATPEQSADHFIRISHRNLSKKQHDLLNIHISEIWTRFFRKEGVTYSEMNIGDSKYSIEHDGESLAKIHRFCRKDGSTVVQRVAMGEDLCSSQDMVKFFAYIAIERLRYIGGGARKYLLENPQDINAVERFVSDIISSLNFIAHAPVELDLKEMSFEVFSRERSNNIVRELNQIIHFNRPDFLDRLIEQNPDLFYLCSISQGIDLDWLIKDAKPEIISSLIDHGFFKEIASEINLSDLSSVAVICDKIATYGREDLFYMFIEKGVIAKTNVRQIMADSLISGESILWYQSLEFREWYRDLPSASPHLPEASRACDYLDDELEPFERPSQNCLFR